MEINTSNIVNIKYAFDLFFKSSRFINILD